jgi:predicted ATPase/class 3 adenylate cyclase
MLDLPTGTVTFLFTDIEGSTKRWELDPIAMKAAVGRHDALVREAIETSGGVVFRTMGDAFCAAFSSAPQAVDAMLAAQKALLAEEWNPVVAPIRVRMALHTGLGELREGDYVGAHLNRIARLLSTGHGGQMLLSGATHELVCDLLPEGVGLRDLGQHKLKDLQRPEHVYQLVSPDLPSDFPPILTLNTIANNLPVQPTGFIGREEQVEQIVELLARPQTKLLTLTGPGGTGKTRLSLQVAALALEQFKDGVFFVPLTAISDPALVPSAIAASLCITEVGSRPVIDDVKEYLRQRELLLVLDNFEQVVSASQVVSDLIASNPQLKVLVTTREVLHLYGEQEFPVPPLQLPPRAQPGSQRSIPLEDLARYESVRLFIERARGVKPGFELAEDNAVAIAEISNRLDGLPLAIELAAARVKLLSPQAILARLDSRLKVLTSGARDLPARQQTLRGAIDWSYDLLSPQERTLFRRMGIFVGGCTLEGAEAVCSGGVTLEGTLTPLEDDVLDGVSSLVDKSLLRQVEIEDNEPRFVMLETIREYALEKLVEDGEIDAARRGHAQYYLSVAEEEEKKIQRPRQREAIQKLEAEHDNLRAVMEWSLTGEGDKELGLRVGTLLHRFWHIGGHLSEGRRWMEALLAGSFERTSVRARALYAAGYITFLTGDVTAARPFLEESRAIASEIGDKLGLAYASYILGAVLAFGGNAEGVAINNEGVALFRELGAEGKPGLALGLMTAGVVAFLSENYEVASGLLEEGQAIAKELGDYYAYAQTSNYLGDIARIECDYPRAGALYTQSLAIFREHQGRGDIPAMLHNLGYVALAENDYSKAKSLYIESLRLQQEIGNKQGISECLTGFAALAGAQEDAMRAGRLFGASEALRLAADAYRWPAERIEWERHIASSKAQLDEGNWEKAWQEGQDMSVEQAVAYALQDTQDE